MSNLQETQSLEIFTLAFSMDESSFLTESIRNANLAVHAVNAENIDELSKLIESLSIDLALINCDNTDLDLAAAISCIREVNHNTSIILLTDDVDRFVDIGYDLDVQTILNKNHQRHIILAIKREYKAQQIEKQLQAVSQKLEEVSQQCTTLTEEAREAIAYIHDGMHVYANPSYIKLFGIEDSEDIDGLPVMDLITVEDRPLFKALLKQLEEKIEIPETRLACQTEQGDILNVMISFSAITVDDEACTQLAVHDLSADDQLEKRINDLTNLDLHTGLYNRKYFTSQLESLLENSKEANKPLGILQIRIQNFSEIRDECGLACSDQLLQKSADALIHITNNKLIAARFGEHDFTILCKEPEQAKVQANLLLEKMPGDLTNIPELTIPPIFSVGIAYSNIPSTTTSSYDLLNRVIQANNHAQLTDTNTIIEYSGDLNKTTVVEPVDKELIELIDYALNHDRFKLLYQPIVSLKGESRENYAVFVRLIDENNEIIEPSEFLLPAEQSNRLVEIDRWVIRNAIQSLAIQRQEGYKTCFFINISFPGLQDNSLLLWICDCLRDFKVKGAWLTFQFKEADINNCMESVAELVAGLRKINCGIAIDRFTDPDKNQSMVQRLTPDVVKFSPELLAAEDQEEAINEQKELNDKLQQQGIKTAITEVEEKEMLPILWDIGVDYIQGHLIQEPTADIVHTSNMETSA